MSKTNKLFKRLPVGTLGANLFATALLAAFKIGQNQSSTSALSCSVLQGLDDGFCGSLSTVSTFAVELRGLRRFDAYRYALISVVSGIVLCVIIYGSAQWSGGLSPLCTFQS